MNHTIWIYGDLLFLLQFLWNLILLFWAEQIGQYRLTKRKRFVSALILSLTSMAMIGMKQWRLIMLLAEGLGLCLLQGHWKVMVSYAAASAFAGGVWMIFPEMDWKLLFFIILLTLLYQKYGTKSEIYTVCCQNHGKKVRMKALLDTGNRLYLPGKRVPVSIAEYEALKGLIDWKEIKKATAVAYSSVGEADGLLLAVQIEALIIPEKNIVINHPYIGMTHDVLSNDNSYAMILHKDMARI